MEFALIIKLILLGLALLSGISYMFQRSGNKQNLSDAINSNQSIRQLTDQEFELLKPYLDNKVLVRPYKYQSSLVSRDVSVIAGSCIRHSLSTNGGESSYYFVIGNIEVFFPYEMDKYTMSENIAEVVFTERYAFIVSLNGYDLAIAKEQIEQRQLLDQQWGNGSKGQFKSITDEEINSLEQQEQNNKINENIAQMKNRRCEILAQRDETVFEHKNSKKTNTGFLTAIFIVLATVFCLNYDNDSDLWILIIATISLILAAVFYWHKPKRVSTKVNRVKGTVEENDHANNTMLIGDNLILTYPKYWQTLLPEKTTIDVDLDITVTDKKLVRYGHSLSISREVENYGAIKYWGRNCFLFIVGAVISCGLYFISSSVLDDALLSYRFLTSQISSKTIYDKSKLKSSSINSGDWVNLNINGASCDINNSYRCNRIFITNQLVDLTGNLNKLPNWVKKLSEGALIITNRDQQVEMLENYEKMYQNYNNTSSYYGNDYYSSSKKYTKLSNIEQLVLVTDDICKSNENSSCSRLKEIFTVLLPEKEDNELETWQDAVNYAQNKPKKDMLIYISTANEITQLFENLSNKYLKSQMEQLSLKLGELQSNNSVLIILSKNHYTEVTTPINHSVSSYDLMSKINNYYQILALGTGHLDIKGLVTDITYREDHTINSITINPDDRYQLDTTQQIPVVLVNIVIFLLIIIITIIQAVLLIYKIIMNKRRQSHILNEYKHLIL